MGLRYQESCRPSGKSPGISIIMLPRNARPPSMSANGTQQLIAAQDSARQDPNLQPNTPTPGTTHCNQATFDIARAVGAPVGPLSDGHGGPALADTIVDNLKSSDLYKPVSSQAAQSLANQGNLVIAAQPNPVGHGHVATVKPGPDNQGSDPMMNNIGRTVGIMPASHAFNPHLQPPFYYTPTTP